MHADRLLVIALCADGAGVLGLFAAAAVGSELALFSLAIVAGGSWLFAVAGIPQAVRTRSAAVITLGRVRAAAGLAVNAVGCVGALLAFPAITVEAITLLVAGTTVSVVYLVLLPRLRSTIDHP